ncbi:MAG: hypothetical protein RR620_08785 [Clostridium sp.]
MNTLYEKFVLFVSEYLPIQIIVMILLFGLGLVLLSIILPKDLKLPSKESILGKSKKDTPLAEKMKYYYTLSRSGVFKIIKVEEGSKEYIEYQQMIKNAGGLEGATPQIIHMFKYIALFSILLIGIILTIVLGILIPDFDPLNLLMITVLIALIGFLSPQLYLSSLAKKRNKNIQGELDKIELFSVIYLKAGYNIYDLLVAIEDVTYYTKPYFRKCINEFYINQEAALQNLANEINQEEFQLLADILKQALNVSNENITEFVEEHMTQLKKINYLNAQAENKKKPLKYVFVLALPLISIIILWFYPLVTEAIKIFEEISNF